MIVIVFNVPRRGMILEIRGDLESRIANGVTRAIVRDANLEMIAWENVSNLREATAMEKGLFK